MVNYYGKFIPNLSSILQPLHRLLRCGQKWQWAKNCQQAFQTTKRALTSAPVLIHYDVKLPLRLATDASQYGIGAVLSHIMPDGSDRPIEYASHTLSKSEQNYSQIEKEALSIVFGIKKFHLYLYGRTFSLLTDHKPLTTIFGPKRGIPTMAAARMQRWALLLAAYSYTIKYRPTQAHGNADALSRLPMPDTTAVGNPTDPTVFNLAQIAALPVDSTALITATEADQVLSQVLKALRKGWPAAVPDELLPYWRKRDELAVEGDTVFWGIRVIIPRELQPKILSELHHGHPGVVRMKALVMCGGQTWIRTWNKQQESVQHVKKGGLLHHTPGSGPQRLWIVSTLISQAQFKERCYSWPTMLTPSGQRYWLCRVPPQVEP